MKPPPGLQIYLRHPVTLMFDLLISEVDSFMPLPRGPLVPICIVFTILVTNERTDERTRRKRYASRSLEA